MYKQKFLPIIKNIIKKLKSDKYDHSKAPKLWMYYVDEGAKKYIKEFGGGPMKDLFPKPLRMRLAKE